jgi:RHS repeat-associated protein
VQYTYDADYLLASVIDELGNTTEYTYDSLGSLTQTTYPDPDGMAPAGPLSSPTESFAYNALNQMTEFTDALGQTTSYAYDSRSRLSSVTAPDPDGSGPLTAPVTTYGYDAVSRLTSVTDALGNVTSYAYDAASRRTSVTLPDPDGTGPLSAPVTSFAYDNLGRLTSVTDPLSRVTSFTHDVMSRQTSQTLPDPDGSGPASSPVWSNTYTASGRLATRTDPLGAVISWTYDDAGRLITETFADPDGTGPLAAPEIDYEYDLAGNLVAITGALGAVTSYTYDARGRRTGTTLPDPDGTGPLVAPTLSWSFDDVNRLSSETDARGSVTSYSYDNLGRLVERTLPDPDGSGPLASPFESFTHNAAGQMTSATDPLSNVTNYTYDNLGRLTQVELPDPDASGPLSRPTTTYAYDALGRRTSLTDPESNVTSWSYDNLGRLVSEIDPLSEVTSFAYDAAGRLTERTDRRGLVTEFNYDDLDRMTSEVWKDGSSTVRTLSFSHDAVGNLLSASDPSASYDYAYDNLYRATQTEVDYGAGVNLFRLTTAFDATSRRTSLGLEVDSGSGWGDDLLNSYSFDSLGRVTQITQAGQTGGATVQNKRVDFAYTVDGLFDSITRYKSLAGGSANEVARSEYTRDDLGRITSQEHLHDTTSIADYNFTYDAYSRITQVAATSLVGLAGTTDFTYDTTGQLTAADHTHISDEAYSYDENGNRTNSGYTTGTGNRMTSDGTFNYTYDDNGNRLTKVRISTVPAADKTVEYQWDHRNRLIGIVTKNNSGLVTKEVDYEYDVLNRRVSKSIDADGAGPASAEVTRFVYDGGDILAVTDASGDITHRMLHGPAVDQILAIEEDATGEVLWGLIDHLGSIRDIVDNDGNVENHIVYDAFGKVVSETAAAVDFLFGFTGRERDEESGLNYHRARYYDTATGRWLSNDPIGFAAGDTNIQRYVGNNPVNYVDPSGLTGTPVAVSVETDSVDSGGMWEAPISRGTVRSCIVCHNPIIMNGGSFEDLPLSFQRGAMEFLRVDTVVDAEIGIDSLRDAHDSAQEASVGVASVVVEPVDWYLTIREIWNDPSNPWSYPGLLPFIPAVGGILIKRVDDVVAAPVSAGNTFPSNPNDLLPGVPRTVKPNGNQVIHASDRVRIRAEAHPINPGEIHAPRHHDQHYHVEIRLDPTRSWNKPNNVQKVLPPNYQPGHGTGFLPGENFPGM